MRSARRAAIVPAVRPYVGGDWKAVLEVCLLAFAPACESLERLRGVDLDWRAAMAGYLRSLTQPDDRRRLLVAEVHGSVVGFVRYEVDPDTRTGSLGVSAVHPARQGRGIGSLMYESVLEAMRAEGLEYASADAAADSSHARARRAYEKAGFVAQPTVHYLMKLRGSDAGASPEKTRTAAARSRRRWSSIEET
jgi:ribosomal protein S18 acetylase RimI-like enzyme